MKPRLVNSVRILISSRRKLIFPNTTVTVILSLFSSSLFLMVLVHLVPALLVPRSEEEQVKNTAQETTNRIMTAPVMRLALLTRATVSMVMRRPSWHQATRNTPVPRVVTHRTAVYRYELSSELVKKVSAINEGFKG